MAVKIQFNLNVLTAIIYRHFRRCYLIIKHHPKKVVLVRAYKRTANSY